MPSQEEWILRAARLFPSPTPDHIRTSDIPLVLICLDIDDEDLSIRRALGVGRVREIPVSNLVRVLTPILPAENSASERYMMFKTFDKYNTGIVSLTDFQRVAVGAGLLTAQECARIMSTLSNTGGDKMTFDHWCYILKDETNSDDGSQDGNSLGASMNLGRSISGGNNTNTNSPGAILSLNPNTVSAGSGSNSPKSPQAVTMRSRGSSRIGGFAGLNNGPISSLTNGGGVGAAGSTPPPQP